MSVTEILQYLRLNVNVLLPDGIADPAYLELTDEQLTLYLKLALAQPYFAQQGIEDLSDITAYSVYALILFAKRELYSALAVRSAKDVSMSAGDVSMSKGERFSHYADLIRLCDEEIDDLTSGEDAALGGTGGTAFTYTYSTPNRPNTTKEDYPAIGKLKAVLVTDDSVYVRWGYYGTFRFAHTDVYVSLSPILLKNGFDVDISVSATLAGSTSDYRNTAFMVNALSPDTTYHIAVVTCDKRGNRAFAEIAVTTKEVT
jgi:hypothetical protein